MFVWGLALPVPGKEGMGRRVAGVNRGRRVE